MKMIGMNDGVWTRIEALMSEKVGDFDNTIAILV